MSFKNEFWTYEKVRSGKWCFLLVYGWRVKTSFVERGCALLNTLRLDLSNLRIWKFLNTMSISHFCVRLQSLWFLWELLEDIVRVGIFWCSSVLNCKARSLVFVWRNFPQLHLITVRKIPQNNTPFNPISLWLDTSLQE